MRKTLKNSGVDRLIAQALREDIGKSDVTTTLLIPKNQHSHACIIFRQDAVVFGLEVVKKVFRKLDRHASFDVACGDGSRVKAGTRVMHIRARTRALLTGERVALNFLGHLSGIATKTASFVARIQPYKTHIMDTRKTTPGFRLLEKQAVRAGGGTNHRFDLNAMVLIKDNHHCVYRLKKSLKEITAYVRRRTNRPVEIEVENLTEFHEALDAQPDIIMLDNMHLSQIKKAVMLKRALKKHRQILLEVSGNVNLNTVRSIAKTGVERISIGGLTHTRKAIDVSLEIIS